MREKEDPSTKQAERRGLRIRKELDEAAEKQWVLNRFYACDKMLIEDLIDWLVCDREKIKDKSSIIVSNLLVIRLSGYTEAIIKFDTKKLPVLMKYLDFESRLSFVNWMTDNTSYQYMLESRDDLFKDLTEGVDDGIDDKQKEMVLKSNFYRKSLVVAIAHGDGGFIKRSSEFFKCDVLDIKTDKCLINYENSSKEMPFWWIFDKEVKMSDILILNENYKIYEDIKTTPSKESLDRMNRVINCSSNLKLMGNTRKNAILGRINNYERFLLNMEIIGTVDTVENKKLAKVKL